MRTRLQVAAPEFPGGGGLELSRIIYGAWRLTDDPSRAGAQEVLRLIDCCLEVGMTSFDHADIYGGYACEKLFGQALALRPGLRERLELIGKCDICLVSDQRPEHTVKHYDTSARHLRASVERSLRLLGTDRLDLLLLHRPDPLLDAEETATALQQLCRAGKVRRLGVSNFTPSQVDLLRSRLDAPLVCNQIELSLLHHGPLMDGTLDHCQLHGMTPMAWSPLAGGRLFGKGAAAQRIRAALQEECARLGAAGIDQVALAWLLRHPAGILPVIGTGDPERIARAAGAVALELDRQAWFRLYEAALGHEVP